VELLQVQEELDAALALHGRLRPKRILEIGCWDGGTLREWLQAKPPPTLVVAVSLEHRQPEAYEGWRQARTQLVVGTGDSMGADMQALIREHAPYDWAFIDGEHSYPYVRHDMDMVMPLMRAGGAVLLHDITPPAGDDTYGPLQVLEEAEAAGYQTDRYECGERFSWSAGIGVVHV
jgi:predicted O-methyltransferase YrrM